MYIILALTTFHCSPDIRLGKKNSKPEPTKATDGNGDSTKKKREKERKKEKTTTTAGATPTIILNNYIYTSIQR